MTIDDFDTMRLSVQNWAPMLNDPSDRQSLEDALAPILVPPVLQPLPPSMQLPTNTAETRHQWVTDRAAEADVYVLKERPFLNPIGLLILATAPNDSPRTEIHLGYLLAEKTWGKGVATELLQGLIAALPKDTDLSLIGGVGHDNPASARVLEKAGFQADEDRSTKDTNMFVFSA